MKIEVLVGGRQLIKHTTGLRSLWTLIQTVWILWRYSDQAIITITKENYGSTQKGNERYPLVRQAE